MKKILLTFVLLVGIAVGLFAQKLTYQAVVRDNNQQLVVNTDVKATVTITFSTGNPYSEEVNATTNIHGLLSIEFGGDALNGRDWTDATIAVKVVNAATPSTVYVNDGARPVSAVPYALSVNGQSIQNYLTEHHYVDLGKLKDTLNAYPTTAVMDARHYLTSDSAVITTMQGNITVNANNITTNANNIAALANRVNTFNTNVCDSVATCIGNAIDARGFLTSDSAVITTMQGNISENANNIDNLIRHTAKAALRDSVAGQIHDSISNIAAKAHTHHNKDLLDNYDQTNDNLADAVTKRHAHGNADILNNTTATYTDADSIKLKGIEAGAQKNVQSDWAETNEDTCSFIRNKPELFSGSYNDLTNKPSITDTVNTILSTGGYVTETALDNRHYLRSDSTVITTMQGKITSNATNITSLQSGLSAAISKEKTDSTILAGRIDALEGAAMDCNKVKECIKDTLSKYTVTDVLNGLLQQLEARLTGKIDSLARIVDSLSNLTPGGGDTPTEVADGQPCPGAATVSDGTNTYNTVKIGNQCWMKENLRTDVGGGVYPKKGQNELSEDEKVTYGRLYTWDAMMKGAPSTNYPAVTTNADTIVHGICPAGWHVPSNAEWDTLTHYVFNSTSPDYKCGEDCGSWSAQSNVSCIANALSSSTGWQSPEVCAAGHSSATLNKTGFSAVPAGGCFRGHFSDFGSSAYFWSATQYDDYYAWYRSLYSFDSYVYSSDDDKDHGFSVRCLRD